ncbi:Parvulin-like PPIase [Azospirillaceae bacterium]
MPLSTDDDVVSADGSDDSDFVISVNGIVISEEAVAMEMQHHPAPTRDASWRAAAQALVIRSLLCQEAQRRGLTGGDDDLPLDDETPEEAGIRRLMALAVSIPEPTEEDCRQAYHEQSARYRSSDLFEAAHIFIPALPNDVAMRQKAKAEVEALIETLNAHPEQFAALAQAHSQCPSAQQGGSLGQIGRGQTTPEFESFLYALEPGQLCKTPVPTAYGYHVVRLDKRESGRQIPFDLVQSKVADDWRHRTWRREAHRFIKVLIDQARIEGMTFEEGASLSAQ